MHQLTETVTGGLIYIRNEIKWTVIQLCSLGVSSLWCFFWLGVELLVFFYLIYVFMRTWINFSVIMPALVSWLVSNCSFGGMFRNPSRFAENNWLIFVISVRASPYVISAFVFLLSLGIYCTIDTGIWSYGKPLRPELSYPHLLYPSMQSVCPRTTLSPVSIPRIVTPLCRIPYPQFLSPSTCLYGQIA